MRRWRQRDGWYLLAGCVALLCASHAFAHEIPRGQRLLVQGERIFLTTNRGVLLSTDGCANFYLHCGSAAGLVTSDDPPLRLLTDGRLMLATFRGVQLSSADYCDFTVVDSAAVGTPALSADPADGMTTLVATNTAPDPQGLYRSTDDGASFALVSELPPGAFFLDSLVQAPSDVSVVYATAIGPNAGGDGFETWIVASGDGGATFDTHAVVIADDQDHPRLWAVDPTDPQVLFMQVPGRPENGRLDALMRSGDGGQSFETILELDTMRAFAIAPDGSALWAGGVDGVRVSTDGGDSFAPLVEDRIVTCLGHFEGRLWVCIDGEGAGSFPGLSYFEDDGETLTRLLSFDEVAELPACPADSDVGSSCDMAWEDWTRELLTPVVDPDAGMSKLDAGTGGTDAGSGPMDGPAAGPDGGGGDAGGGGCGCRLAGRGVGVPFGYGPLAVALLWLRRRALGRRARARITALRIDSPSSRSR